MKTPKTAKRLNPFRQSALRGQHGYSSAEAILVGTLLLLPVVAFFLDAVVLIGATMSNQSLADNAARAAGSYPEPVSARAAIDSTIAGFSKSALIPAVNLDEFAYYTNGDNGVMVGTAMKVNLPVPAPGIPAQLTLKARSWQPNTALRPGNTYYKLPQGKPSPAGPAGGVPGAPALQPPQIIPEGSAGSGQGRGNNWHGEPGLDLLRGTDDQSQD